jgi:hypothetical protein
VVARAARMSRDRSAGTAPYAAPVPESQDPLAAVAALEGVPSALAAARDGIDARLRDRGRRRTGPEVTTESLLLGAVASASLEGSSSTAADIRAGVGDSVAEGAVRVSSELLGLLPAWRSSPVQAMARLHSLAADPALGEVGQPRTAEGAARLHALSERLREPTTAPALAVAAVVHAEVAHAAAFGAGDGIVARAAERLVLVDRGVDPASVTVPEAGHAADPVAYRDALRAYGSGGVQGVTAWLLHAAQAYTRGAQAAPLP